MLLFKKDDQLSDPEAGAKEFCRLIKKQTEISGLPFAYSGKLNSDFIIDRSTVESYTKARDYGLAKGWFTFDPSGTRISITPEGEDA